MSWKKTERILLVFYLAMVICIATICREMRNNINKNYIWRINEEISKGRRSGE